MMNSFSCWKFYNPVRIFFGADLVSKISELIHFRKGLLVTSPGFTKRKLTNYLLDLLKKVDLTVMDIVAPNPDIDEIEEFRKELAQHEIHFILGVGGGSVLDTAKALSFLLADDGSSTLRSFCEKKVEIPLVKPIPLIAIPTTSGTGSEVTPFATIWDRKAAKKYSLDTPSVYPDICLIDPKLTLSLPQDITTISGLDALSHSFESLWNRNANPISVQYALQGINLVLHTLPLLLQEPYNLTYRTNMSLAALLGGLSISCTRTALAHSISYPLTARLFVPHGLAASFTLPAILEFNAQMEDDLFSSYIMQLGYHSWQELKNTLLNFFTDIRLKRLLSKYISSANETINLIPEMINRDRAVNNLRSPREEDIKEILFNSI